jgi:hypothetical protein
MEKIGFACYPDVYPMIFFTFVVTSLDMRGSLG